MGNRRLADGLFFLPVKACAAFGLACVLLLLSHAPAFANPAEGLELTDYYEAGTESTSGLTDMNYVGDYACNNGVASGSIYRSDRCQTANGFKGIFSGVICRIESILGQTIGELYCAVSHRAEKPFLALLILYITIYGAMVILGMNQAKLPEALMHVFKVGVVSVFILNAPLALGVGYKFYISTAQTAAGLAFSALEDNSAQEQFASDLQQVDPTKPSESTDAGYLESRDGPSAAYQNQGATQWIDNADRMFFKMLVYVLRAMSAMIIIIIIIFFVAPSLFFLLMTFFAKIFQSLLQIIIGYLLALVGLTFLFSLAPIIVPLWLFRFSQRICMTWLKYLASYAIQIGICMVFIALFTKVDFMTQLQHFGSLGRQKDVHVGVGWLQWRFMQWTLCRVERDGEGGRTGDIVYYRFDALSNATERAEAWNGYPRCIPTYTYNQAISGERTPPSLSAEEMAELKQLIANGGDEGEDAQKAIERAIEKANNDNIMDFWDVLSNGDLMFFFVTRLLASIGLAIIMTLYLKKVPSVAERIANTVGSGQIGGGEVEPSTPSMQSTANPLNENDPFNLQRYTQRTGRKVKQSRQQFAQKHGRFYIARNASGLALSVAKTPLALLGVGARKNGGYLKNIGSHMGTMGRRGLRMGYATSYHTLAGANAFRSVVSRRLANPNIHARLAYNARARQQMMDDIDRRELLWEGEQLTRVREDDKYQSLGKKLLDARNSRIAKRRQQRAAAHSPAGRNSANRPAGHQRGNPTQTSR